MLYVPTYYIDIGKEHSFFKDVYKNMKHYYSSYHFYALRKLNFHTYSWGIKGFNKTLCMEQNYLNCLNKRFRSESTFLALSMPIFKKKSSWIFLGESSKLCIVVTYTRCIQTLELCNFIPAPLRTLSI